MIQRLDFFMLLVVMLTSLIMDSDKIITPLIVHSITFSTSKVQRSDESEHLNPPWQELQTPSICHRTPSVAVSVHQRRLKSKHYLLQQRPNRAAKPQ